MNATNKPQRAYHITIDIGADTMDELMIELRRFVGHIQEHGLLSSMVSGGTSCGGWIRFDVDEAMTHDRYVEDLEVWLDKGTEGEN